MNDLHEISLLELLQKEKDAVTEVNCFMGIREEFLLNAGKEYEEESALRIADEYRSKAQKATEKLTSIRSEMSKYLLSFIEV